MNSSVKALEDRKSMSMSMRMKHEFVRRARAAKTAGVPGFEPKFQSPEVISRLSWDYGAARTPTRLGRWVYLNTYPGLVCLCKILKIIGGSDASSAMKWQVTSVLMSSLNHVQS